MHRHRSARLPTSGSYKNDWHFSTSHTLSVTSLVHVWSLGLAHRLRCWSRWGSPSWELSECLKLFPSKTSSVLRSPDLHCRVGSSSHRQVPGDYLCLSRLDDSDRRQGGSWDHHPKTTIPINLCVLLLPAALVSGLRG